MPTARHAPAKTKEDGGTTAAEKSVARLELIVLSPIGTAFLFVDRAVVERESARRIRNGAVRLETIRGQQGGRAGGLVARSVSTTTNTMSGTRTVLPCFNTDGDGKRER